MKTLNEKLMLFDLFMPGYMTAHLGTNLPNILLLSLVLCKFCSINFSFPAQSNSSVPLRLCLLVLCVIVVFVNAFLHAFEICMENYSYFIFYIFFFQGYFIIFLLCGAQCYL